MSTLTVTAQVGVWPPRKQLTAAALTGSSFVTINRIVGGQRTPVRGANDVFVGTSTLIVIDAELPFGLPVSYELIEADVVTDTESAGTTSLPGGKVALTDAITGLAAEVVVLAHDPLTRTTGAAVYNVDGKNYVVADPLSQWEATWEYYTETTTALNDLTTLLEQATAGIIQQRQPGGYDGVDWYVSPQQVNTRRFSQDGSDERRVTAVQWAQCSGWPLEIEARGYNLQDVADAYTGQTLADLSADYATLLLLAQGDFS